MHRTPMIIMIMTIIMIITTIRTTRSAITTNNKNPKKNNKKQQQATEIVPNMPNKKEFRSCQLGAYKRSSNVFNMCHHHQHNLH
jgi:protein involved in sex pheromone biosynthesis